MNDQLIDRIRRKDRESQHLFYRQFSAFLFRVVYRYVSNEQDAASIVNITFFKIFENVKTFIYRDDKCLLAWMKKIAINESLIFLRQRFTYDEIESCHEKNIICESLPDTNLLAEDYYRLIRKLPADLRTVFNLFAIDGLTHREIAERLKIKESSSRVYLSRARFILMNYLKENSARDEKLYRQDFQTKD